MCPPFAPSHGRRSATARSLLAARTIPSQQGRASRPAAPRPEAADSQCARQASTHPRARRLRRWAGWRPTPRVAPSHGRRRTMRPRAARSSPPRQSRISRPAAPPRRRTLTARTASRHTPLCGTMAALGGLQTHAPWQLVAQQVEGRWRARPSWLAAVAVHARRCRGQPAPSLARPRWMVAERCAAWPASPNSCFSEVGCHSFLRPRTILPCGVSC